MKQNEKNATKVANVESVKAAIENAAELSDTERLASYMANHAIEHYCDALGLEVEKVTAKIEKARKDDCSFWVYTQPAIGGTRADGKPNPTQEEWEKLNPDAVRCDVLDSKQWYKKAVTIEDAKTVRRISASLSNYGNAIEKGKERKVKALKEDLAMLMLSGDLEGAQKVVAEIKALQK